MIERDELVAWLRLLEAPGLGREAVRRRLARYGSVQAAAATLPPADAALEPRIDALLAWLHAAGDAPRHVIPLGDPRYPPALLEAPDPPLLLYAEGQAALLDTPGVAVVGSRNPTAQGADNARQFAAALAHAGLTIVSGLALGIDGAAHEGALAAGGATIAIVGTGLDVVYPRRHAGLARRIARQGVLVSEYSLGTPSRALHFPQRNRIIAGLSRATLVVEAALQSGSLITARLAAEAGRDVLAIPGSIHSPLSRGCHHLIKQGAKLVDAAQDILDELGWGSSRSIAPAPAPASAPHDDPLLDALGHDPVSVDGLVGRTGWTAHAVMARLLALELAGHVGRLPGLLFQRLPASPSR